MQIPKVSYQRDGLIVHEVKKKGRAVFTTMPIPRGGMIFVTAGKKIPLRKLTNKNDPQDYCFQISSRSYFCPLDYEHPDVSWFVNHSCDGNMYPRGNMLTALRDIKAGEELTYDYALMESNPEYKIKCFCKTSRCRGFLTGNDWKIFALQKRYQGFFEPYLQKKIDTLK